ncbi:sialidase family protein [Desulfovibrio ferrophilus]|uniref:Sialidase n=1 Tax=Desulfovibrio ferrophilus TaxID=241368 RepID=A0A2Z6AVI1_9BACT|nr:sialidase family protein [Desulfovibrio ferrophilus]BBD07244.1 sialidase [Desulfovibrio ferrophilus]
MHSLTSDAARHTIIDRREGHYLSFPDLWRTPDGELLCAYREADEHVPNRRRLLLSRSMDGGASWTPPQQLHPTQGHCPRFSQPRAKELILIDDAARLLYRSHDQGRTWTEGKHAGMPYGIPDRVMALPDGSWLSTAHRHEGEHNPIAGQKPATQGVFRSQDHGANWEKIATLGGDPNLVLCEASMTRLPDGRILALLRENSQVFEPMYFTFSSDDGRTWSAPEASMLIGHRPTLGLTRDKRLLVTYRNRGPAGGTVAWLGDIADLEGFAVHSSVQHGPEPELTTEGLLLKTSDHSRPIYALYPLTNPIQARATLEARVKATGAGGLMRLGIAWQITETAMSPLLPPEEHEGAEDVPRDLSIPLPHDQFNTIRLEYNRGCLEVLVNDEQRATLNLPAAHVRRRMILVGANPSGEGTSKWQQIRQMNIEPDTQKTYVWDWESALGQPDARVREQVLELAADPRAAWCDYGYSGWAETENNSFVCAYHHGGGDTPGYEPGKTSFVRATRFGGSDFER